MENQAASTSPPAVTSHCSSVTAQNAGVANVPQVLGCQIGGSLNITLQTHMHSAQAEQTHQQVSAGTSNIACTISERVTENLKNNLKHKFERIFEGIAKRGNTTLLNSIYTELFITEGEREGLNEEHEVWRIDTAFKAPPEQDVSINCNDLFKPFKNQDCEREPKAEKTKDGKQCQKAKAKRPRNVLTKGIAGIGKTISVQKFILDWAEGKANQDIDLVLVFPFRELNSVKEEKCSFHELMLDFYSELKEFGNTQFYADCKIIFIFDGLDESQLPLDFGQTRVSVVSKPASLDVLMTNLIEGNLLPTALVWITSRPAAVDKIPPDLIHRMTEVQGFTGLQKEEYFMKRISDQSLASRIISHVKGSRSLEIMCHIPVFCWITATVLEQMLKGGYETIPTSLTEMYTRFLLIQTSEKKKKYLGIRVADPRQLSDDDIQLILKLGKLAFDTLLKNIIVFSEDHLRKYDIDVGEASLRSGVFTEIFRQEDPMFSVKKYSFVHLSFQEFLAAFYVVHTFTDKGTNALLSIQSTYAHNYQDHNYGFYDQFSESDGDGEDLYSPNRPQQKVTLYDLQTCAIDKALNARNGKLDLFLRFLLGLSMESCQKLLIFFPVQIKNGQECIQQTVQYIKSKLREEDDSQTPTAERCINLFQCLLELNDHSMAEEIQRFLTSGRQAEQRLTAGQCSTLAYIILMSGEVLEELDLKKYNTSEEGRRRLIPAAKNCRKAVMADCRLTNRCCATVASVLHNPSAHLRELDISQNFLGEKALILLLAGLSSPHCRLETLDLSLVNLEKTGAAFLDAVLLGPHIQPHKLKVLSCSLTDESAVILVLALWSSECRLRELDLSYNNLSPNGVKLVIRGLLNPNCDLQILRLSGAAVGADSCSHLASVLRHAFLRELHLDSSNIGDVGAKRLCRGLMSPHCQLQILGLKDCKLSKKACFYLTVALTTYCVVRELNLGDNDLQDSGVKRLSTGLKNPNCILQNLGLSGCMITEEGCSSLSSALQSNPCHLRELDLSYNHPGESGEKLLSARLKDRRCKLKTLKLDHGGHSRLTAGLWKYYQELNLSDSSIGLEFSADRKGVIKIPKMYMDSDDENEKSSRRETAPSREELEGGRFYWELEWSGPALVGVCDKGSWMGNFWVLSLHQYLSPWVAVHEERGRTKSISAVHEGILNPERIGVLLDWPAGTLSFYSISPKSPSRLYTFHTTFSNPVYAVFRFKLNDELSFVAIATPSPASLRRTKAQLSKYVKEYNVLQKKLTEMRGGWGGGFLLAPRLCNKNSSCDLFCCADRPDRDQDQDRTNHECECCSLRKLYEGISIGEQLETED